LNASRHWWKRALPIAAVLGTAVLGGCTETRFASPLQPATTCDARLKGLWAPAAVADDDVFALYVDPACVAYVIAQEKPSRRIERRRLPLTFAHIGAHDYAVASAADVMRAGSFRLPAVHGVDPAPAAWFYARYAVVGDRLDIAMIDSHLLAKRILENTLDGTIDKTAAELHVFVSADAQQTIDFIRDNDVFESPREPLLRRHQSIEQFEHEMARAIPKEQSNG
jgi:hypothetical protein